MALFQNNLLPDHTILWLTGFCSPEQTKPMPGKIAEFFNIADRTARRWIARGLPAYARRQLIMILDGRMLPPSYKGIQICADGIRFSGHFLPLNNLKLLPFILKHVDWSKVPPVVEKQAPDISLKRFSDHNLR